MSRAVSARRALLPALALIAASVVVCLPAAAQDSFAEARASSVTGHALLTGASGAAFALTRGYVLNPGDIVDTRGGGRVVIQLTDGSMVVVEPQSVITLKDYRAADSLRELFAITLGQVRVKINHFAGRPNPYRMNSPTASIAVRGTEFSVMVDDTGATQVVVYEGAVEVSSLSDPSHKALIEAGHGVLVPPGGGLELNLPAVGRQANDRGSSDHDHGGDRRDMASHPDWHPPAAAPDGHPDHDENSPRATAGAYERYIAGLSEIGPVPFLLRYTAIPEAHLDSLENPAFATGFHAAEARLFVLPAFSGSQQMADNPGAFGLAGAQPLNYSFAPQFSLFAPAGGFVLGGSVTGNQFGAGAASGNFFSGAALAARQFGPNSLGVELEQLHGGGSSANTSPGAQDHAQSLVAQTRLTAGFTRALGVDHTLGVFYRYGWIDARDGDLANILNGAPAPLDSTRSLGHTAELGVRLRGTLSSRLMYGFVGSWLGLSLDDALQRSGAAASHQRDRATRASAGFGLAYLLKRRAILSLDAAGGVTNNSAFRTEDPAGALVQNGIAGTRFFSLHAAVQTDVWRHLFVLASFLNVWQGHSQAFALYPDSLGRLVPVGDSFFPLPPGAYLPPARFSDFGAGWRFSPGLTAQYVFSTDYGASAPSHALMLRYTFHFHRE